MVQVLYCSLNYEGLGLQDEYLRSDGVGRDFLKLMLEDLNPTSFETVKENRHNIVQDGKLYLNMQ
jgi:3-oxoacyl-[acyl-carrier-protein] synthase-3